MNRIIQEKALSELGAADTPPISRRAGREPVHVVYGGAHLFRPDTPSRLGKIALSSIESFAPNFVDFARAVWLEGADSLPTSPAQIQDLEFRVADNPARSKVDNPAAWLASRVFQKTVKKLDVEPVEDYRIDFEDGYGIRSDDEEDAHCLSASNHLAELYAKRDSVLARAQNIGTGIRIKSFQPESRKRSVRTLDLFLTNLLKRCDGVIPGEFVVTIPKIKSPKEPEVLAKLLSELERRNGIRANSIGIEVMIETPESVEAASQIAEACGGRCRSAHFGAFDYTASLGISAAHQHIRHSACEFARNILLNSLTPLGVRLSDSVTVQIPTPPHRRENLTISEIAENRQAVRDAWRKHFNNVTRSQINGFYQSWDLHPGQLVARYAAVYSFYLSAFEAQTKRLRIFLDKAAQAMTTGTGFDDLASAEGLFNFVKRGVGCRAFSVRDVVGSTQLTEEEFARDSFLKIMEKRLAKSAS